LEEYLQDFAGCVIVVSHDRYFTDKVVDHLLVFHGQGDIQDFPGNYSQYREWKSLHSDEENAQKKESNKNNNVQKKPRRDVSQRKMTYKERLEFAQLEKDIATLEEEQQRIEEALCSGTLSVDDLTEKSKRLSAIKDEIDEKTMRWLELSEIES
jgi:ATP-binding cassette subfamily F protein uup